MSEAEKYRLAIVDPVGSKAGMDYYNDCLVDELSVKRVECFVYSNYKPVNDGIVKYRKCFQPKAIKGVTGVAKYIFGFFRAATQCRKNKVDIVVLHLFSSNLLVLAGYLILKINGLRILTIAHDISSFAKDDNRHSRNLIYNWLSTKISVHNAYSRDLVLHFLSERKKPHLYIANLGSFQKQVLPGVTKEDSLQALGLGNKYKYLLFFGQIKKVKGLQTILKAMPDIDENVKLVIAGKLWKDDFSEYQEIIDTYKLEDRVILHLGFVEDADRDMFFKSADALVLPYLEIYQSAVLLMALSYGLPVIGTRLPFFEETVEKHKLGLLFPVGSEKDLAAATNTALTDDRWLAETRKVCEQYLDENHRWSDNADCHISALFTKSV